jgi:preprotein translocase subunit SecY
VSELRKKLFFTLGILIVHRIGSHIPAAGIDLVALQRVMEQSAAGLGSFFGYLDLFSGGSLKQCAIFALGIMPYITSSIVMQLLTMTTPSLEVLSKEGEYGRKIINQYTRYLTFAVAFMQSLGLAMLAEKMGWATNPGWAFRAVFILTLTVGCMFVMWLGEQISLFGIGNGASVIIFAGIVSRFPTDVIKLLGSVNEGLTSGFVALFILAIFVAIAAGIVFLEKGERKIPVQYSRRIVGQRIYGGQSTYIPFKINTAGIMPVIFSNAVLNVPMFAASILSARFVMFRSLTTYFNQTTALYNVIDFLLIIFFSFVYTAMVFNPEELADNIKKSGGFIPGIRPGRKTAEFFNFILTRIGLIGALYLGFLAISPNIFRAILHNDNVAMTLLSGTSLLIMVGVALDMAAQIESYLIEHRYEGFLSSGRMKVRGATR